MIKKCEGCQKDVIVSVNCYRVCCSDACRKVCRKRALAKYDKSEKGIAAEKRWRLNPIKKIIDKRHRSTERAKHLAVLRSKRQRETNPYAQEAYKRTAHIYMSYTQGKLRQWWAQESKNGCRECGSFETLGIDHIIPKSAGGSDESSNLQCLCRRCNSIKGANIYASNV